MPVLRLILPRRNKQFASCIHGVCARLPELTGSPVRISFLPQLTAYRGRLLSRQLDKGTAVHAASYIHRRQIVLETALLHERRSLRLIVIHELFHFVWVRLSNQLRAGYGEVLMIESEKAARGELGESAAVRKAVCRTGDARWRDYVCESFCDTAAWLYSGYKKHSSFTLAERWQVRRTLWFNTNISKGRRC